MVTENVTVAEQKESKQEPVKVSGMMAAVAAKNTLIHSKILSTRFNTRDDDMSNARFSSHQKERLTLDIFVAVSRL